MAAPGRGGRVMAENGVPYGSWVCTDEDMTTRVRVSPGAASGLPRVEMADLNDGEEFEIDRPRPRKGGLRFRVHVPSTGHRTLNRLVVVGDGAALMEYTPPAEQWTLVDCSEPHGPRGEPVRVAGPTHEGLVGVWGMWEGDECSAARICVRPTRRGAEVSAWDAFCGAAMAVSDVRGRGRSLRLDTRGAEAELATTVRLRLTGKATARVSLTLRCIYEQYQVRGEGVA